MSEPRHADSLRHTKDLTPPSSISVPPDIPYENTAANSTSTSDRTAQVTRTTTRPHFPLEEAHQPASAAQISELFRVAQDVDRKRQQVAINVDEVDLLRAREDNSWARHDRYHDIYVESRSLHESSIKYRRIHQVVPEQVLRFQRRRLDDDRLRLELQHAEASDLQRERHDQEAYLRNLREGLDAAVAELVKLTLDLARSTSLEAIASSTGPAFTLNTADLYERSDVRLKYYYDRASDVKIIAERRMEHEQQQYQDIATRGLRMDRDEILSIPDDKDFHELYNREQGFLEKELEIAVADANRLRDICLDEGLDPDRQPRAVEEPDIDVVDDEPKHQSPIVEPAEHWDTSLFLDAAQHLWGDDFQRGSSRTAATLNIPTQDAQSGPAEDQSLANVQNWVEDIDDGAPAESFADEPWIVAASPGSLSPSRIPPAASRSPSPELAASTSALEALVPDALNNSCLQREGTSELWEEAQQAALP
ncbi:hypothetical protein LTR95_001281 [Oleoguttula sp. CCFEE 5521]